MLALKPWSRSQPYPGLSSHPIPSLCCHPRLPSPSSSRTLPLTYFLFCLQSPFPQKLSPSSLQTCSQLSCTKYQKTSCRFCLSFSLIPANASRDRGRLLSCPSFSLRTGCLAQTPSSPPPPPHRDTHNGYLMAPST